ncbi:hypothetical protein WAK64_04615 [Bacillus spongiae]|uniref:Uncharacterized protein n=1 Tax=Bacillus spongiae TaxID=2683610 RepID=A0ABU8HAN6_9BACI
MKVSTILKWITGTAEAIVGIPVIGGIIVLYFFWTPLIFLTLMHIAALFFSAREGEPKAGNIVGIVTNCIAWIPFVGMVMHIITAVIVLNEAYNAEQYKESPDSM